MLKRTSTNNTSLYVLTENHMQKLDELISELQCIYCDIYSNRQLTNASGSKDTPAPNEVNLLIKNTIATNDLI